MNTPTTTPSDQKPGDREATTNASKRAERRGTADPQVNVAAVRLALADARDMAHLKQLLEAEGIEVEFDRRGQAQTVYGWRLRRRGAAEWLKASSLARDLSWPKIAHRFVEADLADTESESSALPNPASETLAPNHKPAERYSRAPAMVRGSLGPMASKPSMLDFDLAETRKNIWGDEVLAAPAKLLVDIGFTAMKLGAEALKALIRFIQWLLAKFGFGTAAASAGSAQAKTPLPFVPVIDVESRFLPEPNGLKLRSEQAHAELEKVAEALKTNDVDLLPQGEGRAELVAALTAERRPFSLAPEEDNTVDFLAGLENVQRPEEPQPSALKAFEAAAKAQHMAWVRMSRADKVDPPESEVARKKFATAAKQLQLARAKYAAEREKKPSILRFALPSEAKALEREFAAHVAAKAGLEKALRDHAPVAPAALQQAFGQASVAALKAANAALAEAEAAAVAMKEGEVKQLAIQRVARLSALVKDINQSPLLGQVREAALMASDTPKLIAAKVEELEKKRILEAQKLLQNNVPRNDVRDEFVDVPK